MILIDGKKAAAELREELKKEVADLKIKHNKVPGLTVILIGASPLSVGGCSGYRRARARRLCALFCVPGSAVVRQQARSGAHLTRGDFGAVSFE